MSSAPTTMSCRAISATITALHLVASINSAASFQCVHPIQQQHQHFSPSSLRPTTTATSTALRAKSNNNNNNNDKTSKQSSGGKGFGNPKPIQNLSGIYSQKQTSNRPKKYSLRDKSYGIAPLPSQTLQEARESMSLFFQTHDAWKPLFRHVSSGEDALAHSFLRDTADRGIWGISTAEGRTPWKLLPSKPTDPSHLDFLSDFLDEWQTSLLDIPVDALVKEGTNDVHFLEEGRRTIAVTRFHVHTASDDDADDGAGVSHATYASGAHDNNQNYGMNEWETELFAKCWSEMAHHMSQDASDTGSLIVLPSHPKIVGRSSQRNDNGDGATIDNDEEDETELLTYLQSFVDYNLRRPIQWLGRQDDWEIVAFQRGSGAIRMLYKLSDIPDLGDRDSGNDEQIRL